MNHLAVINCPFCKAITGSQSRKTLYIYSTDTYWCARCKSHGLITEIDPLLFQGLTPRMTTSTPVKTIEYNNNGERFSVCKQRNYAGGKDTFQIKLADGQIVGHYTRSAGKVSNIEGTKGFCYREQFLDLLSTYRIVEGPYDCIYPNDVSILGYPTTFQARQLKWFKLILCPDGDVWKKGFTELKKWLEPFWYHRNIVGIEYCHSGLDPDECLLEQRKTFEFDYVKGFLNND